METQKNIMIDTNRYIDEYNFNRPIETTVNVDSKLSFYIKELKPESLLVGEPIFDDNKVYFIKESLITPDGRICEIKTKHQCLHIDDIYRYYLQSILEYQLVNDEYYTFYPVEGMDFDDIKRNGWRVKYNLDFIVPSYEGFINNLGHYMDFIRSLNK